MVGKSNIQNEIFEKLKREIVAKLNASDTSVKITIPEIVIKFNISYETANKILIVLMHYFESYGLKIKKIKYGIEIYR